jgi:hypothetical protein
LRGYIDRITPEVETAIVARVRDQAIGRIFLDGSNLGRFARAIKRRIPDVEVLTFFHNVEARFFFGALKQYRSANALGVLAANYASERMAVRYSDRLSPSIRGTVPASTCYRWLLRTRFATSPTRRKAHS